MCVCVCVLNDPVCVRVSLPTFFFSFDGVWFKFERKTNYPSPFCCPSVFVSYIFPIFKKNLSWDIFFADYLRLDSGFRPIYGPSTNEGISFWKNKQICSMCSLYLSTSLSIFLWLIYFSTTSYYKKKWIVIFPPVAVRERNPSGIFLEKLYQNPQKNQPIFLLRK